MRVSILGTRGIPAQHGGFETFAEHLALYLVSHGWDVTVYCQATSDCSERRSTWKGICLYHIPVDREDALGTIYFDWKSTLLAMQNGGTILNLGYGTAIFHFLYRLGKTYNLVNMDGIEWSRKKWSPLARAWLYLNERLACLGAHHLIADHPHIARHLETRVSRRKISIIPYGADAVESADLSYLEPFDLEPNRFALVVARPDPDNSILEIVEAFSKRSRGLKLVVLGTYNPEIHPYHRRVIEAAGPEVAFLGGIYERRRVEALRFYCRLYIHGHRVGGTNPSLVESLAAGSPVLAHNNPYNYWVAGGGARYFYDTEDCASMLDLLLERSDLLLNMKNASIKRHKENFRWEKILLDYESLLSKWQI